MGAAPAAGSCRAVVAGDGRGVDPAVKKRPVGRHWSPAAAVPSSRGRAAAASLRRKDVGGGGTGGQVLSLRRRARQVLVRETLAVT